MPTGFKLKSFLILLTVAAISITAVACRTRPDMTSRHVIVAKQFADALAAENFDGAYALLSAKTKVELSVTELRRKYKEMTDYGAGPAKHVEVMQEFTSWPDKQKDDVGWVYVAIAGENFSEAITIVVAGEGSQDQIRSVEWGRP